MGNFPNRGEDIGSEHNTGNNEFVELKRVGSSVLLVSVPNNLVQKVTVDNAIVSFKVEEHIKKFNQHTNRRYSALKLPNEKGHENTNAIISQSILRRKRRTTGLRSPKIAPLFLNIKYQKEQHCQWMALD